MNENTISGKKIIEIKTHIITNLPRPIIDNIGLDYFSENKIIFVFAWLTPKILFSGVVRFVQNIIWQRSFFFMNMCL